MMNINFGALAHHSWEMTKGTFLMGLSAAAVSIIYRKGAVQFSASLLDLNGSGAGLLAWVGLDIAQAVDRIFHQMGWREDVRWTRFVTVFTIAAVSMFGLAYKASQGNAFAAYLLTASIIYKIALMGLYGVYLFHSGLEGASQAIFSPDEPTPAIS